jgi:hypothetical protein
VWSGRARRRGAAIHRCPPTGAKDVSKHSQRKQPKAGEHDRDRPQCSASWPSFARRLCRIRRYVCRRQPNYRSGLHISGLDRDLGQGRQFTGNLERHEVLLA